MNINKSIIITIIIVLLLVIIIPTTYKVLKTHQKHLIEVTESKIIEAAKKCYYEEKCLDNPIKLKELYNLNYLEQISNPLTKEYYNEESIIKITDNNFEFVAKE